jgi:uncharacterized protein (DUF2249 family)
MVNDHQFIIHMMSRLQTGQGMDVFSSQVNLPLEYQIDNIRTLTPGREGLLPIVIVLDQGRN